MVLNLPLSTFAVFAGTIDAAYLAFPLVSVAEDAAIDKPLKKASAAFAEPRVSWTIAADKNHIQCEYGWFLLQVHADGKFDATAFTPAELFDEEMSVEILRGDALRALKSTDMLTSAYLG